jgi:hypothetical protein
VHLTIMSTNASITMDEHSKDITSSTSVAVESLPVSGKAMVVGTE